MVKRIMISYHELQNCGISCIKCFISDLDEIKQQLENTIGTEELQQKLKRARSRVSESQSDSGSVSGEKQSLSGSLKR
jgi:hypothetical protein